MTAIVDYGAGNFVPCKTRSMSWARTYEVTNNRDSPAPKIILPGVAILGR